MTPERIETTNIPPFFLEKAAEKASQIGEFSMGLRVLMLIQRASDGGHTNNSKLRSYISRNEEEWVRSFGKLLEEQSHYPDKALRIYQTLNRRDIEKGIRNFKGLQLDNDYADTEQCHWFYVDIKNRMVSCLMKPNAAASSYFLIDVDDKDPSRLKEVEDTLDLVTQRKLTYMTKNGFHIITNPYNPNIIQLPDYAECKKDAMMLLSY